jgi:hypothetical protein
MCFAVYQWRSEKSLTLYPVTDRHPVTSENQIVYFNITTLNKKKNKS